VTLARTAGVIVLAALAFAAAYLATSAGADKASAPSGLRELSFPSPAVALPAADSRALPSLARAPRPKARPRPSAPRPGTPAPAPAPAPAPPPAGGGGGEFGFER